jgi:hypothetical protein
MRAICRWLLDSLFVLIAGAGLFELATAHFLTTIEQLIGDGVPPQPPIRLMTPTGRLASVGACRVPTTPSSKFAHVAEKATQTGHAWSSEERCLRALLTNHGFTISVFVAVAITAMLAFVLEASHELTVTLLVLGILTAVAEYVFRSRSEHQP